MAVVSEAPRNPLDNTSDDPRRRADLILGANDFTSITEKVAGIVERPRPTTGWYIAFGISDSISRVTVTPDSPTESRGSR